MKQHDPDGVREAGRKGGSISRRNSSKVIEKRVELVEKVNRINT